MENLLTTAGGVLLAFYTLRVIDWVKDAPKRAAEKRKAEEFGNMMHQLAHDVINKIEEAEAAKKKPARRKPATKKAPAKKGASNVKAKA